MRFQVKEALDKVSDLVSCDPNSVIINSIEPNNIKLSYVDELNSEYEFTYQNGELYPYRTKTMNSIPS
ncbi:hypothetical protein ACXJY6_07015 [Vibrio sp. RC27]